MMNKSRKSSLNLRLLFFQKMADIIKSDYKLGHVTTVKANQNRRNLMIKKSISKNAKHKLTLPNRD